MGTRITAGPFNRVEGDLEVTLDIEDGHVTRAWVKSPLYRGFEQILVGKDPRDALVFAPRICGICSVSQSMAAAYALADVQRTAMPPNGELVTNLILAAENLADHLTHFYLFFMPDFARAVYSDEPWHQAVAQRFQAVRGAAAGEVLPARAQFLHLMGLLAGKWPHTLALQPGGSTRSTDARDKVRLLAVLGAFRRFLQTHTFGTSLESVAALDGLQALENYRITINNSDLSIFLDVADKLELDGMGRAGDRFMSYGNYPIDGNRLFKPGLWAGKAETLDLDCITEDLSHAWLEGGDAPLAPAQGITRPDPDKKDAYSWCKAPRLDAQVVETGALARQAVNGHPLIRDLIAGSGGNVRNRVIARLLELALVVPAMEDWVKAIEPGEPFCTEGQIPQDADGVGLVEAARGSLGHWISIRKGRIANYQVVAPTTWNFSPRDAAGTPGALEQALVGAPVRTGEKTPVAVQHIVRSFDPCMVCTVH